MAHHKTVSHVFPLLTQWRYCSLVRIHWYLLSRNTTNPWFITRLQCLRWEHTGDTTVSLSHLYVWMTLYRHGRFLGCFVQVTTLRSCSSLLHWAGYHKLPGVCLDYRELNYRATGKRDPNKFCWNWSDTIYLEDKHISGLEQVSAAQWRYHSSMQFNSLSCGLVISSLCPSHAIWWHKTRSLLTQEWLQAITWTNDDIRLRTISQAIPQLSNHFNFL